MHMEHLKARCLRKGLAWYDGKSVMMQARRDEATGRQFFIDHNTRKTTWVRPKAAPPSRSDSPAPSNAAADDEPTDEAAAEPDAIAEQQSDLAASSTSHKGQFGLFGLGLDEVWCPLNLLPISGLTVPARAHMIL